MPAMPPTGRRLRRSTRCSKRSWRRQPKSELARHASSFGDRRIFAGAPLVDVVAGVEDVPLLVEANRPHDRFNRLAVFERFGDRLGIVGTGALDPLSDRLNDPVAE